ncbi:hypothetical protein A1O1_01309 [Capronia coronata CBS 617.96]|uniref:Uncharacterized protein n=1 Tax=Capronia coronata CBS 617.96 TaxID=1182541 RepID=W9YUI0_9EURO|nr:uncharacterized protein A1O1_01309 [Capronia coronata CBS 617.96]EXJ96183.1 hypothetical protein A1O1_01309 [Capronia coronata CBS 617.96]
MPPFPGEETLTTVYADAHTYFNAPTPRPILHRFDKSSYFYIYYNSTRQTSRVEVALHPGTADQAAFNGYLDNVKIINSHTFPTRVTLVVDGVDPPNASPATARAGKDPDEWRLASADPRDPGTTKYRMHTVDFYFWVQEDARLVVDIFQRLLEPHQLDIDEAPETHQAHDVLHDSEHHDMVSPVVQNLEQVAISDPAYHKDNRHGSPPDARVEAAHVASPPPPPQDSAHAQATNPPSPAPAPLNVDRTPSSMTAQAPSASSSYAPLAYNPAAPAAPEPIAHREDTPPPVDAVDGTGLATAAKHDSTYGHHQSHQQAYSAALGPQPISTGQHGHYGSPPPPPSFGPHAATIPHPASDSPHATSSPQPSFGPQAPGSSYPTSPRTSVSTHYGIPTATNATSPDGSRHPSVAPQPQPQLHPGHQPYQPTTQDPNAHIFGQAAPVQTPGTQFYSSLNGQPHKPLQHVQPQYPDYLAAGHQAAPLGGYSAYQYGHPQPQPQQTTATAGNPYDVHNQVYRPTEEEHHTHHHSKPARPSSTQHKPSQAERLEKGVGKLFKKIEKKIG